jgi:hypothetical protein
MSTGINIAPSSDLTVGTTPSTGVDTRVFFQAGGVVQQDANFTFDNTLKRLTLKAVGTAATDIPFRIFNNTETANLFYVAGNKALQVGESMKSDGFSTYLYSATGVQQIWLAGNVLQMNANYSASIGVSNNIAFSTSGGSIYFDVNGRLGIGAGTSPGARLDVRAQGALSTDIAFRVRNSADTQNIVSFNGDGRFLIGQNASNACTGGTPQYAIAIGASAAVSGASETYGSPIAIGYDAQSVGTSALAIGNSTRPNTGIAIGHGVQSRAEGVAIGGSTTNARGTVMGSGSSNSGYGGSSIGYDVDNTGDASFLIGYFHSNSIASSFVWGSNGIKFWVNSNSNLVLANNKAITDANKATYVDTSATNTFTIHSGTAPVANIADAFQQYSADITAGNAAPHFRTENGNIIKLYRETTAVSAATFVANTSAIVDDTATFGGYTMGQVVAALKAQGLLA